MILWAFHQIVFGDLKTEGTSNRTANTRKKLWKTVVTNICIGNNLRNKIAAFNLYVHMYIYSYRALNSNVFVSFLIFL